MHVAYTVGLALAALAGSAVAAPITSTTAAPRTSADKKLWCNTLQQQYGIVYPPPDKWTWGKLNDTATRKLWADYECDDLLDDDHVICPNLAIAYGVKVAGGKTADLGSLPSYPLALKYWNTGAECVDFLPKNFPVVTTTAGAKATTTTTAKAATSTTTKATTTTTTAAVTLPPKPTGVGAPDTAPVDTTLVAYVDTYTTNRRDDACFVNVSTNAGVRVLRRFLDIWEPSSLIVDAGLNLTGHDGCPTVVQSNWSGIPGSPTDGKVKNAAVHEANIRIAAEHTASRTPAQALLAYLDDRRGKGYSITDGMGPLTDAYRALAQITTTIFGIGPNATQQQYNDASNDPGVGSAGGNTAFGLAVDFVNGVGTAASTEPAKRFFKYARPYRWSKSVIVLPELVPAESTTPATDGGQPSGHSAEAVRKAIAMAYFVPERFQEMVSRALELSESRIFAGMHSPLDTIGGRIQSTAAAASNIAVGSNAGKGPAALAQARAALMAAVNATSWDAFYAAAHTTDVSKDRFADWATNKANYYRRATYDLPRVGPTNLPAVVPKSAEVLLETRLPYLTAAQRRVVLKTTAFPSGFPLMDDDEGWGRLNLFAAADAYGSFAGDVEVTMDAAAGAFSAKDTWRNDISGPGKLTKDGSGQLTLSGDNSYSGGTVLTAGTLVGASESAFGTGLVYVDGGVLAVTKAVRVSAYAQAANGTLKVVFGDNTSKPKIHVIGKGDATIAGGALQVEFATAPAPGTYTVVMVEDGKISGAFASVSIAGVTKPTVLYRESSIALQF